MTPLESVLQNDTELHWHFQKNAQDWNGSTWCWPGFRWFNRAWTSLQQMYSFHWNPDDALLSLCLRLRWAEGQDLQLIDISPTPQGFFSPLWNSAGTSVPLSILAAANFPFSSPAHRGEPRASSPHREGCNDAFETPLAKGTISDFFCSALVGRHRWTFALTPEKYPPSSGWDSSTPKVPPPRKKCNHPPAT